MAIYKIRDAIEDFRCPFVSAGEMAYSVGEISKRKKKEGEVNETDKIDTDFAVYQLRWEKVTTASNLLAQEMNEAEAIFDKDTVILLRDMQKHVRVLYAYLSQFLHFKNRTVKEEYREKIESFMYMHGDEDDFSKNINETIEKIEKHFRKFFIIDEPFKNKCK